jgi:enamine deaminase RidA (YjgF/YER057c/UK114 family)
MDARREGVTDVVAASEGQLSVGLYSNARVVGDLVFLAGHTALDDDGNVVHPGDTEAQFRYTLDALVATLDRVGASLRDIVSLRLYLTDVRARSALYKIRAEYFEPPYPASTLLGVTALALEGLTVEVDGVAVLPEGSAIASRAR